MKPYEESKLPFKKVMTIVLLSVVVVWTTFFAVWFYYNKQQETRAGDDRYQIVAIVQKCLSADSLNSHDNVFLEE